MNRKLSLKAIIASLFSVVVLTSCTETLESKIIKEYNSINKNVSLVEQEVVILDGTVVLAEKDIVYNVEDGSKKVTTKTLNDIDASEEYSTTTTTTTASISETKLNLSLEAFSSYEFDLNGDLKAVINNDKVKSVLGIEASEVSGNVSVLFDASVQSLSLGFQDVKLEGVVISYKTANGYDAKITTTYTYKD